ncbi:pancreatic triacylglycerol lipase-like isoform X2 [Harpegnathos saltator]|uniref:pancreatic triacylglycerol lipase-like isoform X2 n=1 Tax=Harpegnathos saltator TaxID=610380 RepID=UPI00058B2BAC|nr:pancreatic triacylglycerol lipase-like isoform X2 [Harpegnathos saltator]
MAAVPTIALVYPPLLALLTTSNENYTIFANDHGVAYAIDISEPTLNETEIAEMADAVAKTAFFLYTRKNPRQGQVLLLDDLDNIRNSFWDSKRPTRLITHGWHGNIDSVVCTLVRDAYLKAGDYNVILIDWQKAASYLIYWKSASSVPQVASRAALMLNFLEENAGLNPDTTKLIGHSLGAHISGLAARFANSEINEVLALDPAKPSFSGKNPGSRVDKTDAFRVQVIHTSVGVLGMKEAIGTADFYPNGGGKQPGCSLWDLIGVCAHSRSYMYYAESIVNPKGFRADDVFMGGPILDAKAKGEYVLETASESPFALG